MYWQAQVVAFLRDCKDCGWDFDAAWNHALRPELARLTPDLLDLPERQGQPTHVAA
jgi:hypothetical protein